MTIIQERAIKLIQQLPDEIILEIFDESTLRNFIDTFKNKAREDWFLKKKQAFSELENLNLDLPEDFDANEELAKAMEEKYGITS